MAKKKIKIVPAFNEKDCNFTPKGSGAQPHTEIEIEIDLDADAGLMLISITIWFVIPIALFYNYICFTGAPVS